MRKKTETIYYPKKIRSINDLINIEAICYYPPNDNCACGRCFKYKITIKELDDYERY